MTRVLFAGDIHGNLEHAEWLFDYATLNDVDTIIACGDFGYWPHYPWGRTFLKRVAELAETNSITFYFVDGNHENHDLLDELAKEHGTTQPIPVTDNGHLLWIPRGCVFTLDGYKVMGYGGAYSVDWEDRQLGRTWWKQELINDYAVMELPEQEVDILVTHEAPYGKRISYKDELPISVNQRILVSEIQNKVRPQFHVCGHHHVRETWIDEITDTEVHVLGRDTMEAESVLLLDLKPFEVELELEDVAS